MKIILTALFVTFCTLVSTSAFADGQARARLLIHGDHPLDGEKGRFNLLGELVLPNIGVTPMPAVVEIGTKWKAHSGLNVEAFAGFEFGPNQGILSLRLHPHSKHFWGYVMAEAFIPHGGAYFFTQIDWIVPLKGKWLHLGIEQESWGEYAHLSEINFGAGPNILFMFKKFGLELTLHAREIEQPDRSKSLGPDLLARMHVFL